MQPNIVGFVDHINLPHSTFLVMDFVPIGNLADFLNTPQLENSVRPLVRQCLYALRHLHDRAISHRNIRPESILVRSWRPLNIQLCNFGGAERSWSIARSFFSGPRLHEENFFALDIWALGVLTLAASGCWHQVQAEEGGDHGLLSPGDALPDFRHLPCAALLDGMLKADAWSRHSAEKCLQDPWLQKEVIRKRRGSALEIFDTRPAKRLKNIKDDCTRDCYNDAGCF